MRRSELEVSQRQFLDAKRYAQQALATYRDLGSVLGQFDAFHVMAAILRQEGEYNEAFALYHKALDIARLHKRTSLTAISLSRIADLELALGRKMDAEFNYDEAISIARRSRQYLVESQILLDKARVLLEQAEYAEANGILDRVLEANSEDQAAWSLKGWCLEQFGPGKADEAVDANKRAIESTPGDIWRHKNLASALELQGRNEEAEAKRRWIIETFGVSPMVSDLSALGWCYYKLGELERAAKVFGESIVLSSDTVSDYFDLALVHASAMREAEAVHAYERAISALGSHLPPRSRQELLFIARRDLDDLVARMPSLTNKSEIAQMRELLARAKTSAVS